MELLTLSKEAERAKIIKIAKSPESEDENKSLVTLWITDFMLWCVLRPD